MQPEPQAQPALVEDEEAMLDLIKLWQNATGVIAQGHLVIREWKALTPEDRAAALDAAPMCLGLDDPRPRKHHISITTYLRGKNWRVLEDTGSNDQSPLPTLADYLAAWPLLPDPLHVLLASMWRMSSDDIKNAAMRRTSQHNGNTRRGWQSAEAQGHAVEWVRNRQVTVLLDCDLRAAARKRAA